MQIKLGEQVQMVEGLIKLIDSKQLAVFIARSDSAFTDCPSGRWSPGVGQLDITDKELTDPCLVSNKYCWTVVTPSKHQLINLVFGDVLVVKISADGDLVGI